METKPLGYHRHLQEAGSKALQDALQKAISELTGMAYDVKVTSIDFEPRDGAWMHDEAKIILSARREESAIDIEREQAVEASKKM